MPELPSADGADYLVAYLWDMGPTMVAGMGLGPVTYGEIAAWQSNTGVRLHQWEARILRQLSKDYIGELHDAEKPDCAPPWLREVEMIDKAAVADRMQRAIRAMAGV